jgi:hypothetical protein
MSLVWPQRLNRLGDRMSSLKAAAIMVDIPTVAATERLQSQVFCTKMINKEGCTTKREALARTEAQT